MTEGDASADVFARAALTACGMACGRLGWGVSDFWAATPAELLTVLGGLVDEASETALSGAELRALMEMRDG